MEQGWEMRIAHLIFNWMTGSVHISRIIIMALSLGGINLAIAFRKILNKQKADIDSLIKAVTQKSDIISQQSAIINEYQQATVRYLKATEQTKNRYVGTLCEWEGGRFSI
jgi:hypothetical protein